MLFAVAILLCIQAVFSAENTCVSKESHENVLLELKALKSSFSGENVDTFEEEVENLQKLLNDCRTDMQDKMEIIEELRIGKSNQNVLHAEIQDLKKQLKVEKDTILDLSQKVSTMEENAKSIQISNDCDAQLSQLQGELHNVSAQLRELSTTGYSEWINQGLDSILKTADIGMKSFYPIQNAGMPYIRSLSEKIYDASSAVENVYYTHGHPILQPYTDAYVAPYTKSWTPFADRIIRSADSGIMTLFESIKSRVKILRYEGIILMHQYHIADRHVSSIVDLGIGLCASPVILFISYVLYRLIKLLASFFLWALCCGMCRRSKSNMPKSRQSKAGKKSDTFSARNTKKSGSTTGLRKGKGKKRE